MLNDLTDYMDPFFGNGTIDLPEPEGIAATWFFIKAQTGNTHPGACAPFGMTSVCAYSGAYPTGYGVNGPNTHATPPRYLDRPAASGFTHLQQSGTGAIGSYYNYVRIIPLVGDLDQVGTLWSLKNEEAHPGYYACTLDGTGIRAELTATSKVALHRYTFSGAHGLPRMAVDLSNGGIAFGRMRTIPTQAEVEIVSSHAAQGVVVMEGLPIHVYVECDLEGDALLWIDSHEQAGQARLSLPRIAEGECQPFGVVFGGASEAPTVAEVRVGLSLRSVEQARQYVEQARVKTFDQVARETCQAWNAYANRVQVSGGTEAQREIFYSSLYHSLVKPADWRGESPYWEATSPSEDAFYVDFATMWDQYKTQLPLVLSLYPEHGRDAVNSLLALAEHIGRFPNGFILNADLDQFDNQARSLAHMAIADAYYRRLAGVDWRRALNAMLADLRHERNDDFHRKGLTYPVTHTLDLAQACHCTAQIAHGLGEGGVYEEMMDLSTRWRNAYDRRTGRLIEGEYYEGGLTSCYVWNAVGLFPVTGQPVYLIGSPIFDAASLQLGDKLFTIETRNNSLENIHVQGATLDGRAIDRAYLSVDEVHSGGMLVLEMGAEPSVWARAQRPPSYPPNPNTGI